MVELYKTILVPTDGSEPSNHALEHALVIAEKYDAKIQLLSVVSRIVMPFFSDGGLGRTPISTVEDYVRYQDQLKEVYKNVLKTAEKKVEETHPDLKVETLLKEGKPSTIIVETAESNNVDLIVIGSRGLGGISGLILGSTSRRVVDSCTKPILIIK